MLSHLNPVYFRCCLYGSTPRMPDYPLDHQDCRTTEQIHRQRIHFGPPTTQYGQEPGNCEKEVIENH
ncbi:cytochrome p450 [Lasius niger]|uniref:Cytochrome p450 n=1 Tax=Lasius niger TaxID=67767 RepID=A0A0J7KAA3_LASNI|nr:cytochrome p450 [Lasius niger]